MRWLGLGGDGVSLCCSMLQLSSIGLVGAYHSRETAISASAYCLTDFFWGGIGDMGISGGRRLSSELVVDLCQVINRLIGDPLIVRYLCFIQIDYSALSAIEVGACSGTWRRGSRSAVCKCKRDGKRE